MNFTQKSNRICPTFEGSTIRLLFSLGD